MIDQYLDRHLKIDHRDPRVLARSRRVILLSILIVMLSLGDLAVTCTFLNSFGMEEINPLASFIIRNQSPICLMLFKLGSVMFCVSLLLALRHRVQGELAAWIAALILVALTCRWSSYTSEIMQYLDTNTLQAVQSNDNVWLTFANTNRPIISAPLP